MRLKAYQQLKAQRQVKARIVGCDVSNPENIYRQKRITGVVTRCRYMEINPFQLKLIAEAAAELGALAALIKTLPQ